MSILSASREESEKTFGRLFNDHFGTESEVWVDYEGDNKTCKAKNVLNNVTTVIDVSCDKKLWTYCVKECFNCEQLAEPSRQDKIVKFEEIVIDPLTSKIICQISSEYSFQDSVLACEKLGMTLLTFDNNLVLQGFLKYVKKHFDHAVTELYVDGALYYNQQWYTHTGVKIIENIKPMSTFNEASANNFRLVYKTGHENNYFHSTFIDSKHIPCCGGIFRYLARCTRIFDLTSKDGDYTKTICEI